MNTKSLAKLTRALATARRLPEIADLVRDEFVPQFAADEFILDIASHDLSRAPLIRVGVQELWAKRYNAEFHRLNPVTAALKAHLDHAGIVVRRFADLSREPLDETRFYREYMAAQDHLATHHERGLSPHLTAKRRKE